MKRALKRRQHARADYRICYPARLRYARGRNRAWPSRDRPVSARTGLCCLRKREAARLPTSRTPMRSPIRCSTTCCGTRRAAMPSAERGRVQVASASAPAQSAAPMRPQANRRPHRITSCFEPDGLRAATKRFNGNYLNEETVLAVTRAAEYGMAAAGKLGPAAHVRCQRYQRYPCSSSTIRPVAKMPPAQRGGRCPTQLLLNCDCRSERTSRPSDRLVRSIDRAGARAEFVRTLEASSPDPPITCNR